MRATSSSGLLLEGESRRNRDLKQLVQRLGLTDTTAVDWKLLDLALTHPSASSTANYQQLEFVGDAVVRLVASELLLETYPQSPVGDFAAIRSILVSDRVLAEFAESYGMERFLLMAGSAAKNKAGARSRLADTFEAVLGALYLSTHSMSLVRPWLDPILKEKADQIRQDPARQNYKDALQEWTQAHYKVLPHYQVEESGNGYDDPKRFTAYVWLKERFLSKGKGRSKKAAQQAAAQAAYRKLTES